VKATYDLHDEMNPAALLAGNVRPVANGRRPVPEPQLPVVARQVLATGTAEDPAIASLEAILAGLKALGPEQVRPAAPSVEKPAALPSRDAMAALPPLGVLAPITPAVAATAARQVETGGQYPSRALAVARRTGTVYAAFTSRAPSQPAEPDLPDVVPGLGGPAGHEPNAGGRWVVLLMVVVLVIIAGVTATAVMSTR
jgi:hypothetical protein